MDPLYISPEERIKYETIETTNIKTELETNSNEINSDDFEQKPLIKTEELDLGEDVIFLSDDDGPDEPFLCDHCCFSSFSASLLTQHKVHHVEPTEKEFKCEDCPFKASYKADLSKHISEKHSVDLEFFSYKADLSKHISEKHSVDLEFLRKSTPLLERILKDKEAMIRYKKSLLEADRMTRSSRNEKNLKLVFCCGKCSFKTYSIYTWRKHTKQHRDWEICSKTYFKCGKCGYINFSRMKVIAHMKCFHMQQPQQRLTCSKNINAKIKQEQTQKSKVMKKAVNLNAKAKAYRRGKRDYRNCSRKQMTVHKKSLHPVLQNTIKTVTWYKCGKCSFKDLTEVLVKLHLRTFHV